jgi:hypothetical protein
MAERPEPGSIGNYALDSQIVIRVVAEPLPESPPEVAFVLELPGFVAPEDVAATVYDNNPATPPPHFTLDSTHTHTDWGASGSAVEYVLNVAAGLSAEAILAGIYVLARSAMSRARGFPVDPLDRETALMLARRGIARNYVEAPVPDLALVAEERNSESVSYTFVFNTPSGHDYSATVKQAPGMPSITRVSRSEGWHAVRPGNEDRA